MGELIARSPHEQPLPMRHTRCCRPSPAGAAGQAERQEIGSDRQRAPRGRHPRPPTRPGVRTRNLVELQEVGSGVPEEQVLTRLNLRRDYLSLHVARAVRVHDVDSWEVSARTRPRPPLLNCDGLLNLRSFATPTPGIPASQVRR
jgi:hypothetical protein